MNVASAKKKIFDNRYEVLSIIGRGSRGVVYHARNISEREQEVALKVLIEKKGSTPTMELLRKEALALISARHRYVIRLDDFHSLDGICYLAMELAPLGDLRRYIATKGKPLSNKQAEAYLLQSAEALEYVHKAGILHRDIKPDNLLVVDDKNVRLGDFGVALLPGETSSIEDLQKGIGTLSYMSPEVFEGTHYDVRSDLYSLGLTFFEAISGVHPFENVPLAHQVNARRTAKVPQLKSLAPNAPKGLVRAVQRCLAFDPEDRFQSCQELLEFLQNTSEARHQGRKTEKGGKVVEANLQQQKTKPPKKQAIPPAASEEKEKPSKDLRDHKNVVPLHGPRQNDTKKTTTDSKRAQQMDLDASPTRNTVEITPIAVEAARQRYGSVGPSEPASSPEPTPSPVAKKPSRGGEVAEQMQRMVESHIASAGASEKGPQSQEVRHVTAPTGNRITPGTPQKRPLAPAHGEPPSDQTIGLNPASDRRKLPLDPAKRKKRSKLPFQLIAILTGAAIVMLWYLPSEPVQPPVTPAVTADKEIVSQLVPDPSSLDIPLSSFPNLPSGLYGGSLEGLVPGHETSMAIVSRQDLGKLYIILGIPGWAPVSVPIPTDKEATSLRMTSGTFIIDLKGEAVNGELVGAFRELITGIEGEWHAKRAQ